MNHEISHLKSDRVRPPPISHMGSPKQVQTRTGAVQRVARPDVYNPRYWQLVYDRRSSASGSLYLSSNDLQLKAKDCSFHLIRE